MSKQIMVQYSVKYDSSMKEINDRPTTQMNIRNILSSLKSQIENHTNCIISFIRNSRTDKTNQESS